MNKIRAETKPKKRTLNHYKNQAPKKPKRAEKIALNLSEKAPCKISIEFVQILEKQEAENRVDRQPKFKSR